MGPRVRSSSDRQLFPYFSAIDELVSPLLNPFKFPFTIRSQSDATIVKNGRVRYLPERVNRIL